MKTLRWEALADQPQGSSREGQSKRRGDEEAGEGTSEGAALPALQTEEGATSQGCSASRRGEGWGTIVPGPPEGARPADTSLLAQGDPLPLWETRCQDWRWELPCPVVGGAATPQKALRPPRTAPQVVFLQGFNHQARHRTQRPLWHRGPDTAGEEGAAGKHQGVFLASDTSPLYQVTHEEPPCGPDPHARTQHLALEPTPPTGRGKSPQCP